MSPGIKGAKACEKNGMWKGDRVGFDALHEWVRNRKPRPELCESCHQPKRLEMANISGRYLRNITDYEYICRKCHMEKDGRGKRLRFNRPRTQDEKLRIKRTMLKTIKARPLKWDKHGKFLSW